VVGAAAVGALVLEGGLEGEGPLGHVGQHQLSEARELPVEDCHEGWVPRGALHELVLRRAGGGMRLREGGRGRDAPGPRWGWSELL
jgi:hypothetical protein